MKLKSLFLIAIIFLSANAALAADWLLIAQNTEADLYLDKSSITGRERKIVGCWVKYMFHKTQMIEKKPGDYILRYVKYNLYDRTYKTLDANLYRLDSGVSSLVFSSHYQDFEVSEERVFPESTDETIIEYLEKSH